MTNTEMTQAEEAEENVRIELAEALTELRACEARHHVLTTIGMRSTLEDPTRAARFVEVSALCDRMDELIPVVNQLRVIVNGFDEE
jgi:thioredoxin-like negative regulator of GroEL